MIMTMMIMMVTIMMMIADDDDDDDDDDDYYDDDDFAHVEAALCKQCTKLPSCPSARLHHYK
eukprot:4859789-Karenia_brevis.AAC.1